MHLVARDARKLEDAAIGRCGPPTHRRDVLDTRPVRQRTSEAAAGGTPLRAFVYAVGNIPG